MRLRHPLSRLPAFLPCPALLLLCLGCASKYQDLKAFTQSHEQDVAAADYRIEPPDVLSISSATCPEVESDQQPVGADGKITLKLLGEVKVAGQTAREVAAKLKELLAVYYVEPDVTVRVAAYQSKKIFVFGEVTRAGALAYTGRDSVLDVLAACQPTHFAWKAQVKVIRPGPSPDERHEIVVDVDRIIKTGDLQKNFLLQDGDILYVPPTPLAWANRTVQDVLGPLRGTAEAYSTPATFIAATDYYRNHNSANTYVRISPGGGPQP